MSFSDHIIVIGRQCGSGGREIGRKLAESLGIPYYDRRLLKTAAEELGIRADLLEQHDERRPSCLTAWLASTCGAQHASYSGTPFTDIGVQRAQHKVLYDIMHKGPCVIVGRGADYIGRDLPNVVSLFLHAPLPYRIESMRRGEAKDMNTSEISELIERTDRRRAKYYRDFTGRRWGHSDNYHLSIDTSVADSDTVVDIIRSFLKGLDPQKTVINQQSII